VADVLKQAGIVPPAGLPREVRLREGVGKDGRPVRFYLNFSAKAQSAPHVGGPGTEIVSGRAVKAGDVLALGPWDLAVVRE
jgi:hypothetical protein